MQPVQDSRCKGVTRADGTDDFFGWDMRCLEHGDRVSLCPDDQPGRMQDYRLAHPGFHSVHIFGIADHMPLARAAST